MRCLYADARMPVAMTVGASTYYLGYDQVGSLRVVTDTAGNVVKRMDYDSFGNIIADSNPAFSGGFHDGDTGLVRFGFRDYDPDMGRWSAKDPIQIYLADPSQFVDLLFSQYTDSNLYVYALDSPVNFIDPYGLLTWEQAWEFIKAGSLASLPPVASEMATIAAQGPCPALALARAEVAHNMRDAFSRQRMEEHDKWREIYRGISQAFFESGCHR